MEEVRVRGVEEEGGESGGDAIGADDDGEEGEIQLRSEGGRFQVDARVVDKDIEAPAESFDVLDRRGDGRLRGHVQCEGRQRALDEGRVLDDFKSGVALFGRSARYYHVVFRRGRDDNFGCGVADTEVGA